ncbi:hypothetical protein [Streptomyces inusitatus]|nr:hypothetical protein [Streptomyces inusitatus]
MSVETAIGDSLNFWTLVMDGPDLPGERSGVLDPEGLAVRSITRAVHC